MTGVGETKPPEDPQPPLVPMTDEELRAAAREMAQLVGELETLKEEHAEIRKEHKAEEKTVSDRIEAIASTVRSQGR
jgi:hypothetical protein